jgi:nitrite reductase/ring-hydroxylating ferredoxin subunit
MSEVLLGSADEVPEGGARCYRVGQRAIAVFRVRGELHAIDDTCPHRGGSLSEGDLDGTVVSCPRHGWQLDVTTGKNAMSVGGDAVRVGSYRVWVEGSEILVELPGV